MYDAIKACHGEAALFLYDYTGLQLVRTRNNASINENVDAGLAGLEIQGYWHLEALQGLSADFLYGWLDSSVDGVSSLDPINRTAGNPGYALLNNIDLGALTSINYIAREAGITQGIVDRALAAGRALDIRSGRAVQSVSYPANGAGVSIPVYFSRFFSIRWVSRPWRAAGRLGWQSVAEST